MNVKKKLLSKSLGGLILSLILVGAGQAQVRSLDRIVAIVDNDVIMQSQLDQRLREVRNTISKRGAELPPETVLRQQVMERLISENIQLQMAARSGIRISDEELNDAMSTIAQRNNMTLAQFQNKLAKDGMDPLEAREQIRREMMITRVRQRRVSERIMVSEQEVRNFLASDLGRMELSEEYHLANILIPVPEAAESEAIRQAEHLAEDTYRQLRQGADFAKLAFERSASENALEGGDMGWRKAAQLPPPFDDLIRSLPIGGVTEPIRTPPGFILVKVLAKRGGDSLIRDEVHVRHILIKPSEIRSLDESRRLIERIHSQIQSGEDFGELAKNFSEDPGSALHGGDLSWIDPESLVPEFQDMMAKTPSGALSPPFRTTYGWHILQVMGRRATDSSEAFRHQQALNILRNRRFDEELQAWLRQIRDEAYVDIKQ
ncbi:periplasmic chaperone for outer membrane proteins SurA [Azomonas agilis]|uniref:Chaperone SurA n=1 Tax=Azomonas agilis TaxID=116849 RepID=A0A562I141_9GAMM|nr:peptidylprolyl isomerase [Azomonas agilis]TWH64434.1 periplasmic chaperone for outer membrane proteins SurA [Azomonas agilis]